MLFSCVLLWWHNDGTKEGAQNAKECAISVPPMVEHELRTGELNPYPWYDITCATCCSNRAESSTNHDSNREVEYVPSHGLKTF